MYLKYYNSAYEIENYLGFSLLGSIKKQCMLKTLHVP